MYLEKEFVNLNSIGFVRKESISRLVKNSSEVIRALSISGLQLCLFPGWDNELRSLPYPVWRSLKIRHSLEELKERIQYLASFTIGLFCICFKQLRSQKVHNKDGALMFTSQKLYKSIGNLGMNEGLVFLV